MPNLQSWQFWVIVVLQVIILGGQAYLTKKGENLAMKQDVAEITREIESVKNELRMQLSRHQDMLKLEQEVCETFHDFRLQADELAAEYGVDNMRERATVQQRKEMNECIAKLNTLLARLFIILPDDEWKRVRDAIPIDKQQTLDECMYASIDAMRRNAFPDTTLNAENDIRRIYELPLEGAPGE